MYCTHCGKELPDGSKFCPQCGQSAADSQNNISVLVRKAQSGDLSAISALYEQTYNQVYYTIKSMIKDEDAVFDILQDSYIKAFSHLDSFEGGERFAAWMRQIAANTARDWLKKQRPLLFTELEQNSGVDIPIEERFEDENTEHLPEHVIDQNETSRLIREILDELPEDQRAAIGMYYYEEMSVKEIAASMNATENAVKSRLLYGRRKIEKKVRELEKKGTKLYGLAPIPFLLWLLRGQKAYAAELPDAGILQNVLESMPKSSSTVSGGTAHAAKAAGTANAAATAGTGLSAAKIAVISIIGAAVIGGGVFGITRLNRSSGPPVPPVKPTVTEEAAAVQETKPTAAPETTIEETAPEPTSEPETEIPDDPMDKALEQYRTIIANAETYDFGEYAYPNGKYLYALEYMEEADPVPSLLLCQCGDDYIDHIRVFYYDPSINSIIAPAETLEAGVAQTGGFRGGLGMMESGGGICSTAVNGMRGDIYVSRTTRSGKHLVTEEVWTGHMEQEDPTQPKSREIIWYDISDLSGFDNITDPAETTAASASVSEADNTAEISAISDAVSEWTASEQAAGRIVLTGSINTYSYDDMVELQGAPDPNAAYADKSNTYRVIVLDEPQVLSGTQDIDNIEREVTMICVRKPFYDLLDIPDDLDGQTITFSIVDGGLSWPSDTGMPLGVPMIRDIHVMP